MPTRTSGRARWRSIRDRLARTRLDPPNIPLLIDEQVQGAILFRFALYSAATAIYFAAFQLFSSAMVDSDLGLRQHLICFMDEAVYWGPGLILLLPLIAQDLLRLSHRFVSPIRRLEGEMKRLAEGTSATPVELKEEDFWADAVKSFNALREEVNRLRAENTRIVAANDKTAEERERVLDSEAFVLEAANEAPAEAV